MGHGHFRVNLFPNQTQEINLLDNLPMYGTLNQITIWYFLTFEFYVKHVNDYFSFLFLPIK